jgi:hypothetical protein
VPKKIENPLVTGLPAKICFYCYLEPQTGYGLGLKIYGIPRTDKIYKWIKQLVRTRYLTKTEDGFSLDVMQLVSEIKNMLVSRQVISMISKKDEKHLKTLLNSNEFKKYLEGFYKSRKNAEENADQTENIKFDFNVLELITEKIGMLCTICYIRKKFKNLPFEEDEVSLEQHYRKDEPNNWRTLIEGVKQFNAVVPYFKKFSENFMIDLSKLWSISHTLIEAEYVDHYKKTTEIICPNCNHVIKRSKN